MIVVIPRGLSVSQSGSKDNGNMDSMGDGYLASWMGRMVTVTTVGSFDGRPAS